ncbi:MAG: glycosyltransferase family 41 protein [Alphaproteobacteria bacterium]|nr:glycosyltransferase family 41 protein [Alphaproteobacteria bacterium]
MNLKRKVSRQIERGRRAHIRSDPVKVQQAIESMKAGLASHENGELEAAISHYRAAIAYYPALAQAHNALGVALHDNGSLRDALDAHRKAAELKNDYADAYFHCGNILLEMREYSPAAQMLQQVINMDPSYVRAYDCLGQVLFRMYRIDQAHAVYSAGLALAPDDADMLHNISLVLMLLGRRTEAMQNLEKAIASGPHKPMSQCYLLTNKMYLCDWENIEKLSEDLVKHVIDHKLPLDPFSFQGFPSAPDNAAQLACAQGNAEVISASMKVNGHPPGFTRAKHTHERIRVGYLSMDFRSHPMAYLMTEILEKHDRSKFEISAYSFGPPDDSPERQRFRDVCNHFIEVQDLTDQQTAQVIQEDEIDILINRKGYTFGHRLGILARRPAPLQVNYLAFGGTMGVDFIDYAVVDEFVVPPDQQKFYTERLVYLPDTYQPNSFRPVSTVTPPRAECGLTENAFVFCCFNQTYKITPGVFDIWMHILLRTPGSVLWLLKPDEETAANLRREAAARGVDPGRLVFAPKVSQAKHLARHRNADLFLDTLVVNALTTASDALHMGIPIITCPGNTFVARGAASILRAFEMPELIAQNIHEYEELAVAIAARPELYRQLAEKAASKRETAPLFNSSRYTNHLDAAYVEMWRLHQSGEHPKPFSVQPINHN